MIVPDMKEGDRKMLTTLATAFMALSTGWSTAEADTAAFDIHAGTNFVLLQEAEEAQEVDTLPPPEAVEQSGRGEAIERARALEIFAAVETLQARFRQVNPDGSVSEGDLALSRPGRVRFAYDAPSPLLIVADGSTVAIADSALETVDRAPIRSTPLRWLLAPASELESSGAIVEVGRYDNQLYVTLEDPQGEAEGRVTLAFGDADPAAPANEVALLGWYAVDGMGSLTQVTLDEVRLGQRADPRLFVLDDDMFSSRRRGRR